MKYIVYGWAYIQDMLEHAVIMEQTGMEEDIGVEVQQFPYPCYTYDRFAFCNNYNGESMGIVVGKITYGIGGWVHIFVAEFQKGGFIWVYTSRKGKNNITPLI